MNILLLIIDFAGFVALLLWGVRMVQTGIARAYGSQLRVYIGKALRNRFQAFFSGLGITALLQSSTATGLMMTSFAAGGLVELVPALAVMLGANVGTTLIVQVLSFDLAFLAPLLMLIGVAMFRRGQASRTHDLGRVAIGLGLLLLSLEHLVSLFSSLESSDFMGMLLGFTTASLVADVMLAAFLAWAAHSSIAVVLVVMSLMVQGSLGVDAALAMVLGANLGSAINPVTETDANDNGTAKRLPLGNLLNRLLGCLLLLPVIHIVGEWMLSWESSPNRLIADFHSFFNIGMSLLFLPFLSGYARLLERLVPGKETVDPANPLYLDAKIKEHPSLALTAAAREALHMADAMEDMLAQSITALEDNDRNRMGRTRDRVLGHLDDAIKNYLSELDLQHLSREENERLLEIITFSSNLEHAADILDVDIMKPLAMQAKQGKGLSEAGRSELLQLLKHLKNSTRLAANAFISGNRSNIQHLIAERHTFRNLETELVKSHFKRLNAKHISTHETSRLHLQLLHELKRINDCLVDAASYPLLAEANASVTDKKTEPTLS